MYVGPNACRRHKRCLAKIIFLLHNLYNTQILGPILNISHNNIPKKNYTNFKNSRNLCMKVYERKIAFDLVFEGHSHEESV
jgi:hypothetical protein